MAKAYQERLIALIKDTVTLLCKNGLEYNQEFCVEGLLGVTLDKDEVFLIPIKELVNDRGVGTTDVTEDALDTSHTDGDLSAAGMSPKRERKKKRRHPESTAVQDETGGNYETAGGDWENDMKNRSTDAENESFDRDDQPSSKRRQQEEIKTELSKVKAEDIVVIKEEVDDEEFVSAFQDSSMDSSNLNRTEQGGGDSSMAYYSQPGTSQGGSMSFSMDQIAEQSALSASMAGLPPGSEGDPASWLQQSASNMQTPQGDWQGAKHQCDICQKRFLHRCSLKRHFETTHGDSRFPCHLCNKVFTQRGSVWRHVRNVHRLDIHGTGVHDTSTMAAGIHDSSAHGNSIHDTSLHIGGIRSTSVHDTSIHGSSIRGAGVHDTSIHGIHMRDKNATVQEDIDGHRPYQNDDASH